MDRVNIGAFHLFLNGKCSRNCEGCSLVHPIRDEQKVIENYHNLLKFLTSLSNISFTNRGEGNTISVTLESADVTSMSNSWIFNYVTQIVEISNRYLDYYEVNNLCYITKENFSKIKLIDSICSKYGTWFEVESPSNKFYDGSKYVTLTDNTYNELIQHKIESLDKTYIALTNLIKESDTLSVLPHRCDYVYNKANNDLSICFDDSFVEATLDKLSKNLDHVKEEKVLSQYYTLITDRGFNLIPAIFGTSKFLVSEPFELSVDSFNQALNNLKDRYPSLLKGE